MYISKGRRFETLHEYFNHIADTFGAPRVHEHFESDSVISDGLKLHVDVYEYDPEAPTIVFIPAPPSTPCAMAKCCISWVNQVSTLSASTREVMGEARVFVEITRFPN